MQRQLHIATVLRLDGRLLATGHNRTIGRDLEGLCAGRTRQQRVELRLHARRSLPFGVDRPDDGRSNIAIGVLTLKDGLPLDPVDVELTDLTV